jgi:DNA ligase-1
MTVFKPMLATSFDTLEELVERCKALYKKQGYINYILQPKYDGVRAIASGGKLYSRTGKLIPNKYLQNKFSHLEDGLDGELYCHGVNFNALQSIIMTADWKSKVYLEEEDYTTADFYGLSYSEYLVLVDNIEYVVFDSINRPFTPSHVSINTIPPTLEYLKEILKISMDEGYEGIMFRNLDAPYKHGRSSKTKLELVKIKQFHDAEGLCLGINQEIGIDVDGDGNETPYLKDSMGSLQMAGFKIGTGFDATFRKQVWDNPELVVGKQITYKYQELSSYGIPRFPVFMRIREEE